MNCRKPDDTFYAKKTLITMQITMQTNQAQMYESPALYIQTPCLDRFYPYQYITKDFKVICLFYIFKEILVVQ